MEVPLSHHKMNITLTWIKLGIRNGSYNAVFNELLFNRFPLHILSSQFRVSTSSGSSVILTLIPVICIISGFLLKQDGLKWSWHILSLLSSYIFGRKQIGTILFQCNHLQNVQKFWTWFSPWTVVLSRERLRTWYLWRHAKMTRRNGLLI